MSATLAASAGGTYTLVWPTFIMLVLVGGMYWLSRLARRKLGVGAGTVAPDQLKVVGKRVLEPRKALYVVEIADRYVLVGTAENSVALIDHITADEFAAMRDTVDEAAGNGTQLLRRFVPARATATDAEGEVDGDGEPAVEEQRFATVGESFALLLGKARSARASRATTAATGDDD